MNTLILSFEHNPTEFMEAQKVLWEFKNKPNFQNLRVYLIYGLGGLFFGGLLYWIDGKANGFLWIAGALIINALLGYANLRKRRKVYLQKVSEESARFTEMRLTFTFEFTDEQLKYHDAEKTINLNWSLLQNYTIYKGFLVVGANSGMINYLFKVDDNDAKFVEIKRIVMDKLNPVTF